MSWKGGGKKEDAIEEWKWYLKIKILKMIIFIFKYNFHSTIASLKKKKMTKKGYKSLNLIQYWQSNRIIDSRDS